MLCCRELERQEETKMVSTLDDFTITPNEERDLASWLLKDAYENIVPCSGSKSYCEDITDYPSREINAVLLPNLQQEYFNKVFTGHTDIACQKTTEQVIGQTASNYSFFKHLHIRLGRLNS